MEWNVAKSSLLSDDPQVVARVNERIDRATASMLSLVYELFGSVAVRNLNEYDEAAIRDVIASATHGAIGVVEGAYVDKSIHQAGVASMNMLRGLLTGAELQRVHDGGAPHPAIREFIEKTAPDIP